MLNATVATVTKVGSDGIVVRLAGGEERVLANGDPMLERMDLAYAINTHMAQGITSETIFTVMGAREANLSNARAFLVNHTRQQFELLMFTDDKDKLVAQLEVNRGDKTSALETIGMLAVEQALRVGQRDRAKANDAVHGAAGEAAHRALADMRASSRDQILRGNPGNSISAGRDLDLGRHAPAEQHATARSAQRSPEIELDRSKGLEF